ncbi:glycosyltransferase involved in cell wall biosynthesis [Dysgonomonas sp. PFB1-18]|uniref:glycosyltransferase n=1 Tax=unclassified Dysgonomonas TaxID=2630389 RepID=UPI0024754390|nr:MULTISPECIES: glycosyltransferase [unclassified Dysgonomonas]MDH6307775.1 glycosyltransferase involved in cell wall biosynthesis [Dysgonomonas sp. PF1-14]MDH6337693.1 glycosyltransferase involved in cell wall biosynthesis [Dysgonomonas sp. PF1-16]MDH6378917.1 glycosyltransferase involved in cell wall biosynthesis [Dysgonomonas sp. PFB1-18]MDH6396552.1 glycosyltransferase involved in cell wall biosynthesis [Dysgonomonas sp. PF1-23]
MKLKILHIQETIASGGVEKLRLLLAKYLDKNRYEQKIICTHKAGIIIEDFAKEGVEIISIGSFNGVFDIKQYRKVIDIINEYKPDIIHGAVFEGVIMACVCGFIKKVPIIIAEETSDPQNRSKKASFLLWLLCLVAQKVVAISPGTEEYLRKIAKIPQKKIQLINNGVEYPRIVTSDEIDLARKKLNIMPNEIIVGSVGRLHDDVKKFTDIVKAFSILKDYSNIKLLIVGDGPDKQTIIQTAEELGISDKIIMVGYQYDTALYYKLMDIYCIASQHEGFGLVAAEAMLNGLPVVATAVGGLKSIVIDGETGFLVLPNNPEILAEKLEILIKDLELRLALGENGKKRAMNEYTADIYISKINELYQNLIETHHAKR